MKQVSIKAEVRKSAGTSANNKLKTKGRIPAILYGQGKESTMLTLTKLDFENVFKKNNKRAIYAVNFNDGAKDIVKNTLIKDIQYDPIKMRITHVDFYEYDEHKKIRTRVPVLTHGTPIGLKKGGILTHIKDQVEIDCLPINIPDHFEVDVTNLDVHHSIRVSDLTVTKDIHVISDPHDVLVTVSMPRIEEEKPAAEGEAVAAAVAGEPAQPEVIAKGKAAKEEKE